MGGADKAIRDAWDKKRHLWRDGTVFRVVGPMRFAPPISAKDDGLKPVKMDHDVIEFRREVTLLDDARRVRVVGTYDGVEAVVVDQILPR